jgi:hypothetical protein
MTRSLLLSSLFVLGVGCAGAGSGVRAGGQEVRMGQHSVEPMVVTHYSITGPSSSLSLKESGLRGRFRNLPVELQWDFQQVTGSLGTQPARLELSEGDDLRASGSFGGMPVELLIKESVLMARVGACAYYMTRVQGGFSGRRDCSGPLEEGFYVEFPETLQKRPIGEMATLLTLALASYTESYVSAVSPARFTAPRDFTRHDARSSSRKIH